MTAGVFPGTGLFQRAAAAFAGSVPADPADDGFFGPGSVTWRVNADLSAPVSGLRALLLQALHPLAMAGVDQHSQWRDDPGGRFASTSAYVLTTTFGDRAAARAVNQRVQQIHTWVRGTDPVTGKPYAAGDPELLVWVHAALVDSSLAAAACYGVALTPAEQDQYLAEQTTAAELVGVPPGLAPASVAELEAYFDGVRPSLATSQSHRRHLQLPAEHARRGAGAGRGLAGARVGRGRHPAGLGPVHVRLRRRRSRPGLGPARAGRGPPGAGRAGRGLPRGARGARSAPADHPADAGGPGPAGQQAPALVSEPRLRVSRGLTAMRLAARGGARYAVNAPRLFAAAGEHRQQLRDDLALRTAQDVADTLGTMKGVLMKIGQLASYVDDGIAPPARRVLGRLQDSVPPMSAELAAGVIRAELGDAPERVFREWDPQPIAAASIGQVHRAITADGQAVAVKVQYPGIAETIAADLGNSPSIRSLLKMAAPSHDVTALIEELRTRIGEELDYRLEADSQRLFAAFFDGHPTAHVPEDHRRAVHRPRPYQRAGRRGAVQPRCCPGRRRNGTWRRRRSTASRSARCTSCGPSTGTRTRATTCSSRAARSPSSTSAWSSTSPRPSWTRWWR